MYEEFLGIYVKINIGVLWSS